jgi:hypothetical protein
LISVCSTWQSEVMIHAEEERAISEVVERLAKRFPQLPVDQVAATVERSRPEFDAAPIRIFSPRRKGVRFQPSLTTCRSGRLLLAMGSG